VVEGDPDDGGGAEQASHRGTVGVHGDVVGVVARHAASLPHHGRPPTPGLRQDRSVARADRDDAPDLPDDDLEVDLTGLLLGVATAATQNCVTMK